MKNIFAVLFLFIISLNAKAQYAALDKILTQLEERKGIKKNLKDVNIDNKKFVFINNSEDHTERDFIIIKGKSATYVEVFDDKETGESTSNVFTGDIIRKNNIVSLRADKLENKKIPVPVTKTLLLTQQEGILYLIDVNTNQRWIDEISLTSTKNRSN